MGWGVVNGVDIWRREGKKVDRDSDADAIEHQPTLQTAVECIWPVEGLESTQNCLAFIFVHGSVTGCGPL